MIDFVRICPRFGHANPEDALECATCGEFLGMENPVPAPSGGIEGPSHPEAGTSGEPVEERDSHSRSGNGQMSLPSEGAERPGPGPAFYLEVPGSNLIYTVRDGAVVGQAHPTSTAEVQLSDLSDVNYVHRRHCRFDFCDARWQCTPLDQRRFGRDFTNPTFLNGQRLDLDQPSIVTNGDRLTLSSFDLTVRIP